MRLQGRLSISRVCTNQEPDWGCVSIIVTDESSRTKFLEVDIPFREFGLAVVGASEQPCEFEIRTQAPLGKRREVKRELIPFQGVYLSDGDRAEVAATTLAPFEVNGWKGYADGLFNSHLRETVDGVSYQRVTFYRYVDPETGEPYQP